MTALDLAMQFGYMMAIKEMDGVELVQYPFCQGDLATPGKNQ